VVLLVGVALWTQRAAILGWFGTVLVENEAPPKCDAVLVLAGGGQGERILKGLELLRQGAAPLALVTDAMPIYEQSECRLAVEMALRRGGKPEWFECVAPGVRSTKEEAAAIAKKMRERGMRSAIVVTTEFHTRRAARIFRAAAPEIRFYPVAAASIDFRIERWYESREGRKTIFLEWTKAITGMFGA
jgi:uncharacterized SAM-binding protein YcdF (DUF218 family)